MTALESQLEVARPAAQAQRPAPGGDRVFHFRMASIIAGIAIASFAGCRLTGIVTPDLAARAISAFVVTAGFQPLPLYWHRRGKIALRDSSLCVLWAALLWIVLPFPVDIAARIGRAFPLRDVLLARADARLGVNVAEVAHWFSLHKLALLMSVSYALLAPLLVLAFLVPGLTGRVLAAKRLVVGNLVAFAIGLPFFVWLPAVGPWTTLHLAPRHDQLLCQSAIEQLRSPAIYVHQPAGVICFPSFHVMWAILCACALWPFRWLRVPVAVVAGAIVLSTVTTGWHYFTDVIGGILLAVASVAIARRLIAH